MLPSYSPLLTDFYQLTMAYGYWQTEMREREAVFSLFFRKNPFEGNYTVACGLADVIDYLENWRFNSQEIDYLASLRNSDDRPLFKAGFLRYLSEMKFTCSVSAVPEGTPVFPNTPILRVRGPLIQAQLLETPLLNLINFSSLIATKASRVCLSARGNTVLEFGLRRAQGPWGGVMASRAAYIGGCNATSNTLAGQIYGIPVRGTHAHSWIMAHGSDQKAFEQYLKTLPHQAILLVDTFDTQDGIREAIKISKVLKKNDLPQILGVRLDSGDLLKLSRTVRIMLDEADLTDIQIIASGDLDEYRIAGLKTAGAPVDIWGVGTKLVTAYDDAALSGVYKLTAIRRPGQKWGDRMKFSENEKKSSLPGVLAVRRFFVRDQVLADLVFDRRDSEFADPSPERIEKLLKQYGATSFQDILQPVFEAGTKVYLQRDIHRIQRDTFLAIDALPPELRQLKSHSAYPVYHSEGLKKRLNKLRKERG